MKILFVTATYLPTVNGVSYHIKLLKKQLEKHGHKVFLLAPNFPGYKDTEKNVMRYFSMPNPYITNYPIGLPLVSLDKIKKIKPDIIHTHHPLIIGKFASFISEKLNTPLFFTAHTQYEQYLNYYFPHGYQITSKVLVGDIKSLAAKCRKVICPSPQTETRLNMYGINNTKTVFNGIDTEMFHPSQKIFSDYPSIVYTGRIEKEKNPLFLLKVAVELKKLSADFRMVIIGDGRLLNKMSEIVIKWKLESHVLIVGKVNHELLPNIYKTVNIFLTPSVTEVMPLSVLEAESAGLPILALKNSNLESVIDNGRSGYILPANPKIVAKNIIGLVKNKNKLIRFSKSSRRIAKQYSVENNCLFIEKLYKEAL